jgi:hypothetical protein
MPPGQLDGAALPDNRGGRGILCTARAASDASLILWLQPRQAVCGRTFAISPYARDVSRTVATAEAYRHHVADSARRSCRPFAVSE